MAKLHLYRDNDQLVTLQGLTDSFGDNVTGAAITGTLVDRTGATKATLTFSDVAGVPGNYSAPLLAVDVPAVGTYTLRCSGIAEGVALYTESPVTVATRTL